MTRVTACQHGRCRTDCAASQIPTRLRTISRAPPLTRRLAGFPAITPSLLRSRASLPEPRSRARCPACPPRAPRRRRRAALRCDRLGRAAQCPATRGRRTPPLAVHAQRFWGGSARPPPVPSAARSRRPDFRARCAEVDRACVIRRGCRTDADRACPGPVVFMHGEGVQRCPGSHVLQQPLPRPPHPRVQSACRQADYPPVPRSAVRRLGPGVVQRVGRAARVLVRALGSRASR